MERILLATYSFFEQRRPLLYACALTCFAVLGILAFRVHIEEDITRILPNGQQAQQINDLLKQSKLGDKIIVKIRGNEQTETEALIATADSLVLWLQQNCAESIADIKIRVDDESATEVYEAIHHNLPLFLTDEDYKTIDSLCTPECLAAKTEANYQALTSASGFILKRLIADDPLGITPLALKRLETLPLDEKYQLYDGYMLSDSNRSLVLFIAPTHTANETSKNELLFESLSNFAAPSGQEIIFFGGPIVGVSNARQLRRDTLLTLSITVVSLLAFTFFFFRQKRVPLVMMLPVLFGALFSLAIIGIYKGSISSIALGAGSIILGIAINYSIHFFSHLKHCGSVKQTIADLWQPMTIGSFTTVGSFFSLLLLQSQILNDFGLFAGLSLTGATIFALVFLPHFAQEKHPKHLIHTPNLLERFMSGAVPHQGKVFVAILVLTLFFLLKAGSVEFDSDMNHYSYLDEALQKAQQELDVMQDSKSKTVFIASTGQNAEQVLAQNEQLLEQLALAEQKGWVKKYSSINWFLPSRDKQQQKWRQWNNYWTEEKKTQVLSVLKSEGAKFKFRPQAFDHFESLLNSSYRPISQTDFDVLKNSVGNELFFSNPNNTVVLNAVKVNKATRQEFYASLQNSSAVILDKQIITNSLVSILHSDFNRILLFTSLLVFVSLLVSYGSLELTIITFLPMLISWIWILGIMALLHIPFNLINIIISTFIFGLGDDFSIFTTDGLMKKYAEGKETIASHKVSIILCAATTIIGLGALIFAKHPALKSIALISIIGIFCVLLIGQTVQPFLFNALIQSRKDKGLPPYTISSLVLTIIAFSYYVAGSLLLSLIGYILIYALPFVKIKTRKLWLHHLMCWCLRGLTYMMVNVRKTHVNKNRMDFSKPAIIIANHQSFLDILVTVMQHPKLILLTNRWVYYSPVFGKVVQLADYYPVMEGVDPAIDKFEDIVKDGYSIVVFPEGTRSPDRKLKRFHKGAFFLAEKLKLDIIPMVLHGTGDTIRKGDFMVMNASMTMKFLPRIAPDDKSYGEGYAERTKLISRHFKHEYELLKKEKETAGYFRQQLRLNYTYKGPEVFAYALKQHFNSEKYDALNRLIPENGKVAVLGCSYGYVAYILALLSETRVVMGYDIKDHKIDIAKNGYLLTPKLHFYQTDVFTAVLEKQDSFVVNELIFINKNLPEKERFLTGLEERLLEGGKIILINERAESKIWNSV
ncbi:MAG: 1-acyl-sn-glycerol-3-phosphate acyltransferase [Bacteroidetes bacterium]|nr:1-acyl-sn-glycerol-3-phosphate acyltransferase [Bacteroidota bacterium]